MQEQIDDLISRFSSVNEESLQNDLKHLSDIQKEVIKSIIKYGKLDDKRGMRYTREWILECILLCIKGRRSYIHLQSHNILPLQSLPTLKNYLKNLKPRYGFDPTVFKMLKKKSDAMKPEDRRG